jgi:hypothetical protein
MRVASVVVGPCPSYLPTNPLLRPPELRAPPNWPEVALIRSPSVDALAAAHYLETHARRVYGSACESELAAAKAILMRIRNGDLKDGFTARDVHQRDWAHLTEREHVGAGLSLLVDLDYLAMSVPAIGAQGGRPKITYLINPRGLA